MRKASFLIAAIWFLGIGAPAAYAHKLKVFATAVGADISGYAYFVPGGRAQEAGVIVKRADGSVADNLRTNENGEFSFTATSATDHAILVDAGDGHEASYTLHAAEIAIGAETATGAPVATSAQAAQSVPFPTASPSAGNVDIASIVEQAVARQLRPLREQIDAWQEKIWFHDVLGGLGYIIGIAGLFYGLTGTRRAREESAKRRVEEARQ